jgi:hypothetical protein
MKHFLCLLGVTLALLATTEVAVADDVGSKNAYETWVEFAVTGEADQRVAFAKNFEMFVNGQKKLAGTSVDVETSCRLSTKENHLGRVIISCLANSNAFAFVGQVFIDTVLIKPDATLQLHAVLMTPCPDARKKCPNEQSACVYYSPNRDCRHYVNDANHPNGYLICK